MSVATFHFYGELNFFLPRSSRNRVIEHPFDWRGSIKDMIESLGVPHAEVELIVVNENPVNFDYLVRDRDQIKVYPCANGFDIASLLRPVYPGRPAFVLDQHLGRLAAYLRMMGFDTLYQNDFHDEELAHISHHETRILLTRDIGLLKRSLVVYGYYVRETNRHKQLAEITRRYKLASFVEPFKHCMKCNGLLEAVSKEMIARQLPDDTAQHYHNFHRCISCRRIFWKGPHYQRMQQLMEAVLKANE
jgi:hypothetical protein